MSENYVTGNIARDTAIQINGVQGSVNLDKQNLQPSFFKTSNYETYKNVNPKRVQQTCRWFLEHPKFQRWNTSNQNDILWLSADPGCGKSVLSRALIDEKLVGDKSPVTICYFFFKDNEEQNNICTAMCALLHQILCARNGDELLKKHVLPAHTKCGEALKNDFEELWRTFVSAATDSRTGNVICILDALDECKEYDRNNLIHHLEEYYSYPSEASNLQQSWLKFFVTSRPYGDIEQNFSELTQNMPAIRLAGEEESEQISQEIGIVVEAKVKEIARKCKLNDRIRSSLHSRLCEIPNRTYLWLHLTLSEVEKMTLKGKTEKRLLEIIDNLPNSVENAYETILAGCDREETTKVLQIIVAAQRPLTIREIDVALEVESNSACNADLDRQHEDRKTSIRETCGLFVSIVDSRVFLIHQTAKEFLIWKQNDKPFSESQRWKHSIDLQDAHRLLSQKCVAYLLFPDIQQLSFSRRRDPQYEQQHDFLDYSANHWIFHVQEAGNSRDDWILRSAKLCDIQNPSLCVWIWIHESYSFQFWHEVPQRSALWYAVEFGLINETKLLLDIGFHHNGQQEDLQSVFELAVENECYGEQLISILLEQCGTDIEITEEVIEYVASNRGCGKDMMALLLEQRGDEVKITEEVIEYVASNTGCGKDMMALLLKQRGDEVKITEQVIEHVALNKGCGKDMMALLLEQRGDEVKITRRVLRKVVSNYVQVKEILGVILDRITDQYDGLIGTVATVAASSGATIMALVLDRKGGMVKITEELLEVAARNCLVGYQIMELLLSRNAKVKISEKVLEAAAGNYWQGHQILELLLGRSDKVRITEMVLEAAAGNAGSYGPSVMDLLLRRNDNAKITEQVLMRAAYNRFGHKIMGLLLHQRKEEVKVTEKVVNATRWLNEDEKAAMRLLLEHGSDVTTGFKQKALEKEREEEEREEKEREEKEREEEEREEKEKEELTMRVRLRILD